MQHKMDILSSNKNEFDDQDIGDDCFFDLLGPLEDS